jgi:integrase
MSGPRRLIKNVPDKRVKRTRRVAANEEAVLLAAANALPRGVGPRLHAIIVAALETGCQRSELLALTWKDVDLESRELEIRSGRSQVSTRRIPLSGRMAAVLSPMSSAGVRNPEARVFRGSWAGGLRRGWDVAVLKAYGHDPEWLGERLSPASRAQLDAIDLQFRDLRYEASMRWQEAGWPRQHIRAMLGPADRTETDTIRNAARMGLHELMRRFDDARVRSRARMAKAEYRPAAEEPHPWSVDGRHERPQRH